MNSQRAREVLAKTLEALVMNNRDGDASDLAEAIDDLIDAKVREAIYGRSSVATRSNIEQR